MKKLLIVMLFLCAAVNGQVESSGSINPYAAAPRFFIDLANFKSSEAGKSRVDAFFRIPYSGIQFVKNADTYNASFSITLTFWDEEKDNIIFERIWNEKVSADNFDVTTSADNFYLAYKTVDLDPEKYFVRCLVEDNNSRKESRIELMYVVEKLPDDKTALSSIVMVADKVTPGKGTEKIVPAVSGLLTTTDKNIPYFFDLYAPKAQSYKIVHSLFGQEKEPVVSSSKVEKADSGKNRLFYAIEDVDLTLGNYVIKVEVFDMGGKSLVSMTEPFRSRIQGFPHSVTDLEKAIDQMVYIASGNELDYINDAESYNERLDRYKEFWAQKDPSPTTPENEVLTEYYRRVDYANEKFDSYYDGWRTDMGMIYITLGAPDQVDRHPFEYDSKPYEVWDYYNLNKRFIFVDHTGFGDYRLLNPVYGDWYRYRN